MVSGGVGGCVMMVGCGSVRWRRVWGIACMSSGVVRDGMVDRCWKVGGGQGGGLFFGLED